MNYIILNNVISTFVLTILLVFGAQNSNGQDAITCDGKLYMIYGNPSQNEPLSLGYIDSNSGLFTTIIDTNIYYSALAFNPKDNFIYCYNRTDKEIHRYNDQGFVANLGAVTGLNPSENIYAGGFHENGTLFLAGQPSSSNLYVINISNNSASLSSTLTRQFSGSQLDTPFFGDFSYDASTGLFYGVEINTGLLSSIDPTTGTVTPVSSTYSGANVLSGTYINDNGFYGYGRTSSSPNNVLFRCDISTGICSQINTGFTSNNVDACGCVSTCKDQFMDIIDTACSDTGYIFVDSTYYNSGIYTKTFTSSEGCDSTVTLYLTIEIATPAGCNGVGIEDKIGQALIVYPNPNNGTFTIDSPLINGSLDVISMDGRSVYHVDANTGSTTIMGLATGVYTIEWKRQNDVLKKKVIVVRP